MKTLILTIVLLLVFATQGFCASGVYEGWFYDLAAKAVDMDTDTFKVGLLNNSHSFTSTDDTWANISANEVSATGYTAGGGTIDSPTITEADPFKWDATDETWTITGSMTAYHAVIYDTTNSNSLVCSIDFSGAKTATDGDFKIQWNASGIITISD